MYSSYFEINKKLLLFNKIYNSVYRTLSFLLYHGKNSIKLSIKMVVYLMHGELHLTRFCRTLIDANRKIQYNGQ